MIKDGAKNKQATTSSPKKRMVSPQSSGKRKYTTQQNNNNSNAIGKFFITVYEGLKLTVNILLKQCVEDVTHLLVVSRRTALII